MPTPETAETEADFVARCMENKVMVEDYPTEKQRVAVCHSQYGEELTTRLSVVCLGSKPGNVNRKAGTIEGISILSIGEARGHGMMISEKTLEAAIVLLIGKSLPAYLSHSGAHGDRLLTEAGYFSGFYRDRDQIRARQFTALDTFKKYEREKYDRLFEIAEKAPATFGVSIVFEGQLFWEMRDGSEESIEIGLDAPENSRFEIPTVRPLTITSADFVDTPAANGALFSRKVDTAHNSEDMKSETETLEKPLTTVLGEPSNESASAHHVSDEEPAPAPAPVADPEPDPKPKRKKKKALAQDEDDREDEERGEEDEVAEEEEGDDPDSEEEEEERDADELERPDDEYQEKMRAAVEETYTHLENAVRRLKELMDMTGVPDKREESADEESTAMAEVEKLKARVNELTKLHAGTPPIMEKTREAFTTTIDAKKHLITQHLEAHPKDSRSTAVLAVAKTNPELFKNN